MNNTQSRPVASRIALEDNRTVAIDAPAGAAIRCAAGKLWLTQEGDARDHVVPAGTTFCTDRKSRVVITAIDGPSVVFTSERAPEHCMRGGVTIDSIERFTHAAREAQAAYVAQCFAKLAGWLRLRRVW